MTSDEIIDKIFECNFQSYDFDDIEFSVKCLNLTDEESKKILSDFGEVKLLSYDPKKVGKQCIIESDIHFVTYDIYIKEVATGRCHYKDLAIDELEEIEYFEVKPQDETITKFV